MLFVSTSELTIGMTQPIPRNSVESDHGSTSRIYFDNAGDNVTLTWYNVMLTSQKSCEHNHKYDCSKTKVMNEVYVFSIKYFIEKYINFFYSAD